MCPRSYDTLRFANWMNNGQDKSDTESGAYTLLGGTPVPANASIITRNPTARIFLPSEDGARTIVRVG